MKLDNVTIPIEVRSAGECLDLAIAFYRVNWRPILKLTSCFAVPALFLGYFLGRHGIATAHFQLLTFLVFSPLLGAALAVATGRRVFGEQIQVPAVLEQLVTRAAVLVPLLLWSRLVMFLGLFALLIPTVIFNLRYGFVAELLYLEQLLGRRLGRRLRGLLGAAYGMLFARSLLLMLFHVLLTASLFVLLDRAMELLFDYPIFAAKIQWEFLQDSLAVSLESDPVFSLLSFACAWLTFPLARIAWFFCYLDLRIRREGWDVELLFRMESQSVTELVR